MRLALTAFTRRGYGLAHSLARALEEQGEEVTLALPVRLAQELGTASYECLTAWTGARFASSSWGPAASRSGPLPPG